MPKATKSTSTKSVKPPATNGNGETPAPTVTRRPRRTSTTIVFSPDIIAQRAYELFVESGGQHGRDIEHWLMAERELLSKSSPQSGDTR